MFTELIKKAIEAREKAYAPYSRFLVGAALLTNDERVHRGANVENASYGATICAERVAFSRAVTDGERDFVAIAVVGGKEDGELEFCPPCGICRQMMAEFVNDDFKIILAKSETEYKIFTLTELLPEAFSGKEL